MGRALRRHHAERSMNRRLKEDRNQHYDDLTCFCWTDPKTMARFKEQPKLCAKSCCSNPRREKGVIRLTIQELRCDDVRDWMAP